MFCRRELFWSWVVFILGAGAYVPMAIGGWQHPREINMASYSIWLIVSGMLLYSSYSRGFAGWRMPFGLSIGNGLLLVFGFIRGGYTFNLGSAEIFALYGVIGALSLWVAVGTFTKKWSHRILFLGGVTADILSFYPQLKQYLLPHEPATQLMMIGWYLWVLMAIINVIMVEGFFKKLLMARLAYESIYKKTKNFWLITEESIFSLENGMLMLVTVLVMVL